MLALVSSASAAEERKPRVVIHYDHDGHIARQEVDTTGAGRPNLWVHYERGMMVRQEEDTVGDGTAHVWSFFRDGRLERQEIDTRGRGQPDVWYHLAPDGRIARKEVDTAGSGRRDLVVHYEAGTPIRSEQDENGDGRPERVVLFEAGKPARLEELAPAGHVARRSFIEDDEVVRIEEDRNGDGRISVQDAWNWATPRINIRTAGRQTPVHFGSAISNFGVEELLGSFARDERVIVAFWHAHLAMMQLAYPGRRMCVQVSRHADGEIIARAVAPLGIRSARGSAKAD